MSTLSPALIRARSCKPNQAVAEAVVTDVVPAQIVDGLEAVQVDRQQYGRRTGDDLLGERASSLGESLLALRVPASGWAAEGYVRSGGGSAGLSSAVAVGALARLAAVSPEGAG